MKGTTCPPEDAEKACGGLQQAREPVHQVVNTTAAGVAVQDAEADNLGKAAASTKNNKRTTSAALHKAIEAVLSHSEASETLAKQSRTQAMHEAIFQHWHTQTRANPKHLGGTAMTKSQ